VPSKKRLIVGRTRTISATLLREKTINIVQCNTNYMPGA
jgi:hypothetical protein